MRKEKDEIVFRKHKRNIHTAEKWCQTSSNFTRDNGSQTLGDKNDNQRSSRNSRDYHKRPRSNERRSSRDEKSRRRSRSRDKRKRSISSSRSNRYDSGRNNDKRPRINYPSSTESRNSQTKSNTKDDVITEENPKVLGAYEDISPIKRKSGDASMHLFPTVPFEVNVKSSQIVTTTENIANGSHPKDAFPIKLNFDSSEVIVELAKKVKSKILAPSPQKVAVTVKDYRIAEKVPSNPIDKLKSHLTTKEAITTDVVPSPPLSSQKIEKKQDISESKLLIPKQEPGIIPEQKLVASPLNVVKSPITVAKPRQQVAKSPITFVKTFVVVVESPLSNVKSPVVAIKSEKSLSLKSPLVIKSEPLSPKHTVSSLKSPLKLKSELKENDTSSPVVPTEVMKETEQKVELMSSPVASKEVKIKIESTSPTVWENSNSTYRKEIVDGTEVIKIVRKPRMKKRKVVVS